MRIAFSTILLALVLSQAHAGVLPPPTRTVYKCEDGKKTHYSDTPCVGATQVDVTPTRGLNSSSGREMVGADVRREQSHEQFAAAVRPLTGLSDQALAQRGRRLQLTAEAQQACARLDQALPMAEQAERAEKKGTGELKAAQINLFARRKQFRDLRCE
jgi:hypothetical protein